mmetsp:Transcript_3163/g.8954  ORF Transcript_3163/g.8954 Transcript_3163/m.8954 type:complete len:204 (-) Transcript_3163:150-761(-)
MNSPRSPPGVAKDGACARSSRHMKDVSDIFTNVTSRRCASLSAPAPKMAEISANEKVCEPECSSRTITLDTWHFGAGSSPGQTQPSSGPEPPPEPPATPSAPEPAMPPPTTSGDSGGNRASLELALKVEFRLAFASQGSPSGASPDAAAGAGAAGGTAANCRGAPTPARQYGYDKALAGARPAPPRKSSNAVDRTAARRRRRP